MKPYNTDQTKKEEVREMFDNIAPKYDLLNHTLSMSIDRVWRRRVVGEVRRAKPGRILDVATGTATWAIAMARRIRDVQVLGVDLSEQMLAVARARSRPGGWTGASSSTGAMPSVSPWPTRRSMWRPWRSGCATSETSGPGCANWPAQ